MKLLQIMLLLLSTDVLFWPV